MKKLSALLLTCGFVFLFPLISHAATLGDRALQKGMQGSDVKVLQNLLQTKGYFHYPRATGYYGPITTQAVENFQRTHELKVDGIAGSQTIHDIKSLYPGLNGTSVKNLQEQLKELGFYHYRVTGIYGPITANAVRQFQQAHGLNVSGVAGPDTLHLLHQYAGSPLSESKDTFQNMNVVSTSYTAYCKGCSGISKSGVNLRKYPNAKVVAVDPLVIPLGSQVYVPGYGLARAVDTGSAIQGKRIDVFIPSLGGALEWGRKPVHIKVEK